MKGLLSLHEGKSRERLKDTWILGDVAVTLQRNLRSEMAGWSVQDQREGERAALGVLELPAGEDKERTTQFPGARWGQEGYLEGQTCLSRKKLEGLWDAQGGGRSRGPTRGIHFYPFYPSPGGRGPW